MRNKSVLKYEHVIKTGVYTQHACANLELSRANNAVSVHVDQVEEGICKGLALLCVYVCVCVCVCQKDLCT